MVVRMKRWFAGAATAAGLVGGLILAPPAWAAAVTIEFGNAGGLASSYTENGFTFTPGNRFLNNQCPSFEVGNACLFINNGLAPSTEVEMTFDGGEFDLLGFSFNFPAGAARDLTVTGDNDPSQIGRASCRERVCHRV